MTSKTGRLLAVLLMLVAATATASTITASTPTLVYATGFEDVTKADAIHLSMGIPHTFVFGGDGGAAVWMEGLDRTSGIACHSGSRCVGMELTNIAKSRRCEFKITNLKSLVGDQLFVSVWLYLPPDWQLHGPTPQWYEIADTNTITVSPYAPYTAVHITQQPPSSAFGVNVDYRDLSQVQHFLGSYSSFPLPRGRWFQLQYYVLRHETNGIVRVWMDGKKITDSSGIPTRNVSVDDWATIVAKIYYNSKDTFSSYRLWVDDLEVYNAEPAATSSTTTTTTSSASTATSTSSMTTTTNSTPSTSSTTSSSTSTIPLSTTTSATTPGTTTTQTTFSTITTTSYIPTTVTSTVTSILPGTTTTVTNTQTSTVTLPGATTTVTMSAKYRIQLTGITVLDAAPGKITVRIDYRSITQEPITVGIRKGELILAQGDPASPIAVASSDPINLPAYGSTENATFTFSSDQIISGKTYVVRVFLWSQPPSGTGDWEAYAPETELSVTI